MPDARATINGVPAGLAPGVYAARCEGVGLDAAGFPVIRLTFAQGEQNRAWVRDKIEERGWTAQIEAAAEAVVGGS